MRRRGLGSGLDALMASGDAPESGVVRQIPVAAIRGNRSQPRTHFAEQALEELAASIREHGLIQPIIVSEDDAGGYELIAGERRWRAAQRAGMSVVPALVKSATPQQLLELALVENIQRADLNALEEALAYQALKDDFGLSDDVIARRVGKSRVAVVNTRRLIRLQPEARQALLDGTISAGHGRALLRLEQPTDQNAALELVVRRDLSVRETERLAEVAQSNQLAPSIRAALLRGTLGLAQAQALLRVEDVGQQEALLDQTLTLGLNLRETEQLAERVAEGAPLDGAVANLRERTSSAEPAAAPITRPNPAPTPAVSRTNPDDDEARRRFEELLATPVQLTRNGRELRLTITFFSDEELQAIYERLGG
ncbi:MAG: ParB/RepB/Spo0J family partition protein [Candidatus Viridilinea halotolerans]|uniref:ParB/RepB/Spo0J family partition protein n=1 Tax=Candidatus Viridilinea halotolerans TaxID=2491704 RepID=A0A426U2W2_9CHLR|nr:MAG: ParB/RepB/Spo0J family partition protein [Candidatus Viridilinea halotolerans]